RHELLMKNKYCAVRWMASALALWSGYSVAALYPGNGNTIYGGAVGNGSLNLTDKGTWMSATFNKGGDSGISFHGDLVIFIDCAPGGFNTTSQFIDNDNRLVRDVSGRNPLGTQRAVANFAPGFYADYAIAVGVNSGGAVYKINQTDSGQTFQS